MNWEGGGGRLYGRYEGTGGGGEGGVCLVPITGMEREEEGREEEISPEGVLSGSSSSHPAPGYSLSVPFLNTGVG